MLQAVCNSQSGWYGVVMRSGFLASACGAQYFCPLGRFGHPQTKRSCVITLLISGQPLTRPISAAVCLWSGLSTATCQLLRMFLHSP